MFKKMNKKGQMGAAGGVITLIIVVGVASLVLIVVSVLSGQTYQIAEPQLTAISNLTVELKAKQAAISGFTALETVGNYMPLIVLAIVAFLVLSLILGFQTFGGGGRGGGSVL
jgi:hypothetical protein